MFHPPDRCVIGQVLYVLDCKMCSYVFSQTLDSASKLMTHSTLVYQPIRSKDSNEYWPVRGRAGRCQTETEGSAVSPECSFVWRIWSVPRVDAPGSPPVWMCSEYLHRGGIRIRLNHLNWPLLTHAGTTSSTLRSLQISELLTFILDFQFVLCSNKKRRQRASKQGWKQFKILDFTNVLRGKERTRQVRLSSLYCKKHKFGSTAGFWIDLW